MLKKLLTTGIVTGLAFSALSAPALALKQNTALIFKREVKTGENITQTLSTLVYSGNRVRSENFVQPKKDKMVDGRNVFIYDYDAAELFNYSHSPTIKTAVRYTNARPEKVHLFELTPHFVLRANMVKDMNELKEYINRKGGTKVGTEQMGDYETEVWQWRSGMYDAKVWISEDLDFLTKVQLTSPVGHIRYELVQANAVDINPEELVPPKTFKLETEPLWDAMRDFWPKN